MADESASLSPHRLTLPSPDARSARSPFEGGDTNFPSGASEFTKRVSIPIVQWGQIRIRGRITGGGGSMQFQFVRPARQRASPGSTFARIYGFAQPAIATSAWADGVEFSLLITAAEHVGENWLRIALNPSGGGGGPAQVLDFLDVSGTLLGLYH